MELIILKALNWGHCPMTPNSWVKLYMQVNQAAYIVDINGENPGTINLNFFALRYGLFKWIISYQGPVHSYPDFHILSYFDLKIL